MSNSPVLRGPKAKTATRWHPGKFGEAKPAAPAVRTEAAQTGPEVPESAAEPAIPEPAPPPPAEALSPPDLEALYREELETLREAARTEGYAAGHAEGLEKGGSDAEALRLLLTNLSQVAEDLEQGIARDVLSLSLEIAKQIVRQSLRVKPELLLAIIREAAKSFPDLGDSPRLVVHPDDAELVRRSMREDDSMAPWVITEDARMERGSCKFQNATTEIDATLENRWRRVVGSLGRDDAWLDLNL